MPSLNPRIFIATIVEVNNGESKNYDSRYSSMAVRFKIPGVWENMTKYPIANPIGSHNYPLHAGGTIFVTQPSADVNVFFYQPLDFTEFFGIRNDKSTIEAKKEEVDVKSKIINIDSQEELLITVDNKEYIKIKNGKMHIIGGDALENPLLNKSFTCATCFMTDAPHGTNTVSNL